MYVWMYGWGGGRQEGTHKSFGANPVTNFVITHKNFWGVGEGKKGCTCRENL